MKTTSALLPFVLALALTACGKKEEPAPAVAPAEAPPAPAAVPAQPAEAPPAPGATGEMVDASALYASTCAKCHGELGEGVDDNPKLVGITKATVAAKLRDYRDGKPLGPKTLLMAPVAKNLSDAQIDALASYIGE